MKREKKRRRPAFRLTKSRQKMLMAFFLPIVIVLIAYIAMGIAPFGDRGAMIIDSYHQYVPFFSEFHDKIWHGDSLLYSWHGSLGFNFLAVQAYYLASPLNLLLAVFPDSCMIEAFETLIVLKLGLSGLSAYLYLRYRHGKEDLLTVLFSGFYALGGFSLAYNWNVMWLDSFALLPIVVMGAEKLIDEGRGRLYTIALGLAIFCNYYIAIMICIFQVLYFFAYWFSKKREGMRAFLGRGLHYALCSLLAGGLAAVYLLPTYYTLINSSQGSKPHNLRLYRNFLEVFRQHFAIVEPTQLTGAPNIYCGLLIGMLLLFYVVSRQIPLRERIANGLLAAFLLVSTNVNVLDYVWHGFHFPNNLPGRFSFLYIFLCVVMAHKAIYGLRDLKLRWYGICFEAAIALFAVCLWFPEESFPVYTTAVSGILLLVYMILLWLLGTGEAHKAKLLKYARVLLLLTLTAELAGNSIYGLCMNGSVNRVSYMALQKDMAAVRKQLEPEDTFYRTELAKIQGRDDVVRYHMNGLSFFSSTCDDRMEKCLGALGFYNSGNKYSYKGATPLTDAFLGIKYVISEGEMDMPGSSLLQTETVGDCLIYENQDCLPLGFMTDADILDWKIVEGDPFYTQNDLVRHATSVEKTLFTPMDPGQPEADRVTVESSEEDTWSYSLPDEEGNLIWHLTFSELKETADVYIYFEASHCESLKVTKNDQKITYSDQRGHIVHLGDCAPGNEVTLTFPADSEYKNGKVKLQMFAFHEDVFDSVMEALSPSGLRLTRADVTRLRGEISAEKTGILFLSVPYDEGWTVRVDSEKAELLPVGEGLTGIRLEAGDHAISMDYCPKGFKPGLAISLICLILVIFMARREARSI